MKSEGVRTCAFCRTKMTKGDEEILAQIRKRVELKDPRAMLNMAIAYGCGKHGLSVDHVKCIALLHQAADLCYPPAQFQLGMHYHIGEMGLEQDMGKAKECYKKAAEGGNLNSRHNLGYEEGESGDYVAAMRHWRLCASGGFKGSMDSLIFYFQDGLLQHADLAETLQAFYLARDEMKSEGRDQFIKHLKVKGRYQQEYDF